MRSHYSTACTTLLTCFVAPAYHVVMRTERVNIDQVRNQLTDLIAIASEGGEVIIVQDGKPLARLIGATDPAAYNSLSPTNAEFSSDEESLAWDADGWEELT
jgi:prevent-host-death family protein